MSVRLPTREPEPQEPGGLGYPPRMPLIATDALRLLATVSVAVATVTDGFVGFALMFLVLGGCMVPRGWGLPPWFDALFCLSVIGAGWAALLDYYEQIGWLDLVVHGAVTGLIGVLVALVVHRLRVLNPTYSCHQRAAMLAMVAATAAIALAGMWEIGEWLGHTHLDDEIQVGYTDTITDMVAGCVGAAGAALLVAWGHRQDEL